MKTYHSLPRRRGYALEHDAQVALFKWARLAESRFPVLALMFAIPNGGWRHITTAASLKDEGVKSGVPDIFLPSPARGFAGLFIEMKRADAKPKSEGAKGPLSDEQVQWLSALTKQGYLAKVCYGSEEAIGLVAWYLGGPSIAYNDFLVSHLTDKGIEAP